jgi:hypothetical protein
MHKPFEITIGGLFIELSGVIVLPNGEEEFTGSLDLRQCPPNSSLENRVVLRGTPENGITVEVLEHLFKDEKMQLLTPFHNRNGIRKFSGKNDLYVVLERGKERQICVICHRAFHPLNRMYWEAGRTSRQLPTEKSADKPLVQHMDLSAARPSEPSNNKGNGHGEEPNSVPAPELKPGEDPANWEAAGREIGIRHN